MTPETIDKLRKIAASKCADSHGPIPKDDGTYLMIVGTYEYTDHVIRHYYDLEPLTETEANMLAGLIAEYFNPGCGIPKNYKGPAITRYDDLKKLTDEWEKQLYV